MSVGWKNDIEIYMLVVRNAVLWFMISIDKSGRNWCDSEGCKSTGTKIETKVYIGNSHKATQRFSERVLLQQEISEKMKPRKYRMGIFLFVAKVNVGRLQKN